ncbi:MAG TPA: STAS domain-containing protein [Mycobacteriales bacterium]|jgi:anti-anti-sigma factor|nr:STAS domain-containing protein [Mycobacteriales bacterium]
MDVMTEVDGQVVRLRGRLDVSGTAQARDALHMALERGHGSLVVDLSAVELMDASGLGVLVGAHRRAGRLDRSLILRDVPPRLARILLVTRLDRVLRIERGAVCAA